MSNGDWRTEAGVFSRLNGQNTLFDVGRSMFFHPVLPNRQVIGHLADAPDG
jgi:hypothetical protein